MNTRPQIQDPLPAYYLATTPSYTTATIKQTTTNNNKQP
jgi:hypothetical protein